ncbi:MAG TPA: ABC transporter permease [Acidobacteriaceae bacterium]|jgi:predicted permease|nr:ABC transporter permease [Acidobacteriaceae bacterium]
MLTDVKVALRQLRKSPGFAITAVLTLALGIAANAIVFSVLNALILHPLDVPHSESLYMVQRVWQGVQPSPSQSYPDYLDLRDRNRSFASLTTDDITGAVGLDTGGGNPSVVWPYLVGGNYFDTIGIQPYLGRFFHASDEHGENSLPYIVLNYDFWKTHFHADPSAVGQMVQVNHHPYTILGVAPPGFRGTELFFSPAFFVPIVDMPQITNGWNPLHERGPHFTWVVGHLKSGVTPQQATADLNTIAAALAKQYPKDDAGLQFSLARPGLVGDYLGRPARAFMLGLMLLAGLILLAACANLGSLFAARAADRSREIALRVALGSRRGLIVRQLLTEAIMVSLAGGLLGMFGGIAILRWLTSWNPIPGIPINVPVNPDATVYAVALVLALASGLFFGMVPVRQVLRSDPWQIIRAGSTGVGGMRKFTARDLLLAAQIAICAVLVTSSLVAVRGLVKSLHSNFGFVPQNRMLVHADLSMAGITGDDQQLTEKKMLTAVAAIPGVTAAGYADRLPLSVGGNDSCIFHDSDTDFRPTNCRADAQQFDVSPGYFQSAGTTLLAGRAFTLHDVKSAPMVAVINREFAQKMFGSAEKALGSYYKIWQGTRVQVVGVVENGKYESLTEDQQPAMFYSFLQQTSGNLWLVVRSQRDAEETAAALRTTLRGLDPGLPVEIQTWDGELSWVLFPARVATVALGVLGLLGAMLAVTGIFGMASYVVSRRMRELGIRVALGADRRKVLAAALGRAFRLLAVGSIAGIVLGVLAAKVLASIVYQATPKDPWVLGGVVLTMLVVGLIASWIPAQRALAVDPMILLRDE